MLNLDEANTMQGIDIKCLENYVISCVDDSRGMNIMSLEYLKGHILTDMIPSDDGPMPIKQRNTAWITKIDHYFKEYNKDIVCCVGTAHLIW